MPKPPIIPLVDWKTLFEQGETYEEWIEHGENKDGRETIPVLFDSYSLEGKVEEYLKKMKRAVNVIAIAEDWCPDVIRHVPVLMKLTQAGPNLHVRFITRHQTPEVFTRFLTVGGEAIPKFIFLSDEFVECGNWGPMDAECRRFIAQGKAAGDMGKARERVFARYQDDLACTAPFAEIFDLIEIASYSES